MNDVVVVGTVGKPGSVASATFSPLDRGDHVDVGKLVGEELDELNPVQVGYNVDMTKYKSQVDKYKRISNESNG